VKTNATIIVVSITGRIVSVGKEGNAPLGAGVEILLLPTTINCSVITRVAYALQLSNHWRTSVKTNATRDAVNRTGRIVSAGKEGNAPLGIGVEIHLPPMTTNCSVITVEESALVLKTYVKTNATRDVVNRTERIVSVGKEGNAPNGIGVEILQPSMTSNCSVIIKEECVAARLIAPSTRVMERVRLGQRCSSKTINM